MRLPSASRPNHRPAPPRSRAWAPWAAAMFLPLFGGCAAPWSASDKTLNALTATPYPSALAARNGPAATPTTASNSPPASSASLDQLRKPEPQAIGFTANNMHGRVDGKPKSPAEAQESPLPAPTRNPAPRAGGQELSATTLGESAEARLIQQLVSAIQVQQAAHQDSPSVPASAITTASAAPAGNPSATDTTTAVAAAADRAAPAPADIRRSWRELCEQASAALEAELRDRKDASGGELAQLQQKLRLLYVATERPDLAATAIDELTPAERQAYREVAFALATWLSPEESRHLNLRGAKVLRSLREANDKLAAVSKLDLKNLAFCEKVEGYGWYTQFPRNEFAPRQEVLLYLEVENFAAAENGSRQFETELQGSYQIFNSAGAIVDQRQLPLDRETCRNLRRDYFIAYRIYLPEQLPPGRYRLELTVEDLKAKDYPGRKLGEGMIEFTIRS